MFSTIERQKEEAIRTLEELICIAAIAPENGGQGESEKAERLLQILEPIGFDKIEHHDAKDDRVPSGKRPNIIAYYKGKNPTEKLWIVTHLDVVPPGEESFWTVTEPFKPKIQDGRLYGRGSEDNGQSIIASIFAVKALASLGMRPKRTMALAFVADEEQGSTYGIQHLLEQRIFKKDDLIVVPDSGNEDGSFVEIAEKSNLWFRVRTIGKQVHASRPHQGINAHRLGMRYALSLDEVLHEKYSLRNDYFDPPESTFEMTKKEKNVAATNIIPGEDITHFDCRILPSYAVEQVLTDIRELAEDFEKRTQGTIKIEVLAKTTAPRPTDPNSKIVSLLKKAILQVRETAPKVGGIGGGTCAAFFRRKGIPAAVWSTVDETAHQPNEYAKIDNLNNDTKIFATLAII